MYSYLATPGLAVGLGVAGVGVKIGVPPLPAMGSHSLSMCLLRDTYIYVPI